MAKKVEFHRSERTAYLISEDGKAYSERLKDGLTRELKSTVRFTCKEDKQGYLTIGFKIAPKKNKTAYIHRLVAENFLEIKKGLEVNHKDGNKHNNQKSNLEWVTRSQNMKEAFRLGLVNKPNVSGDKNPNWRGGVWQK